MITSLDRGGAEHMLTQIVSRCVDERGPRHLVITLIGGGVYADALRAAGVEVSSLGLERSALALVLGPYRLARIFRRIRPDLVMTWLYHADLVGSMAARLAGVPRLVWNVRCSAVDFEKYGRSTRWSVSMLALMSRQPWGIAVNSVAGRRVHKALGYRPRRWLYLPNGVDARRWHPDAEDRASVRRELGLADDEVAAVKVARVDEMKDHPGLLAAFERVAATRPNARLILIGRGTKDLRISEPLRQRVIALGEREDVPRLLRGCDLLVLSAFGEGFPNAVAEGMATALPCVVTDVGDAARLVGDTGVVVPARDPAALAEAIGGVVDLSTSGRRALGERARERAARHWSIEVAVERYRKLWVKCLRGPRRDRPVPPLASPV